MEFKLEAVRLVAGGQAMPVTAKILGAPVQTLGNWVRLNEKGLLKEAGDKPVSAEQTELARLRAELALEDDDVACTSGLMAALDELNQRYGRGTVQIASAGLAGERRVWSMKQERRTPGYTTCWADMLVVRA